MAFHHKILGIVTLLYLCLFFIHLIFFAFKKEKIVAVMWPLLYGTLGLHTVGLILRWLESTVQSCIDGGVWPNERLAVTPPRAKIVADPKQRERDRALAEEVAKEMGRTG